MQPIDISAYIYMYIYLSHHAADTHIHISIYPLNLPHQTADTHYIYIYTCPIKLLIARRSSLYCAAYVLLSFRVSHIIVAIATNALKPPNTLTQ